MADMLTEKLAAKIASGPSGPPKTMTEPPEKEEAPVPAAKVQALVDGWKPTTDEGKQYKAELAGLLGGGPELGPGPTGPSPLPV